VTRPLTPAPADWISLAEARRVLGLSASTLRRLADGGTIRTFVTPGGHRRFSRFSVEALIPSVAGRRPPMAQLGETPERLTRLYHRVVRPATAGPSWIDGLTTDERRRYRADGRRILAALLAALDVRGPVTRARSLADARAASADYGRAAAAAGLSPSSTIEIFSRMRRPFLDELSALARRREFDAAATTALLGRATDALDDLLLATLRAQEEAARTTRDVR